MAIVETSELAEAELLQTHYYKASYDEIKEAYLSEIQKLGHNVESIDDNYKEIFSTAPHIAVTAKIVSFNARETAIDFYIDSEFLFSSNKKAYAFIQNIYNVIGKLFELKGLSLHK